MSQDSTKQPINQDRRQFMSVAGKAAAAAAIAPGVFLHTIGNAAPRAAARIGAQIPGTGERASIIGAVTEIPEHLLKRSRERRSAIGKGDDNAEAAESTPSTTPATTASSAPATTSSAPAATGPAPRTAAPEPAAPPPPKPEPVYVQAEKQRKKIPFWAMATRDSSTLSMISSTWI